MAARSVTPSPAPRDVVGPDRAGAIGAVAGVAGVVLQIPLELVWHPSTADPNDSTAAFTEYAASASWTAIHLGQFVGVVLVSVALITLASRLRALSGWSSELALVGGFSVVLATGVFAVQMAVDGVALKHTVDAWAAASSSAADDVAFRVADAVRSIEKGLSALFHLTNGIALVALGIGIVASRRHRWLGAAGAAAGVGFLAGAWSTAHTGFSAQAEAVLVAPVALGLVFVLGAAATLWPRTVR